MFVHISEYELINVNVIERVTYTPKSVTQANSCLTLLTRLPNGSPQEIEVTDGWADRSWSDLSKD